MNTKLEISLQTQSDVATEPEYSPVALRQALLVRHPFEAESDAWDEFVTAHPHGSPFHLMAWKRTMEESFGYEARYLIARDNSGIRGILPLFLIKNPFLGRALISSPFAVYGGILADSDEPRQALYDAARELGLELGVEYIEFRNRYAEQCVGSSNVSRYVGFCRAVEGDEAAIVASLPKKTRNIVRKSLQQGFEVRYQVEDPTVLDRVHAKNMHRLGTPNFPLKYFRSLTKNFGPMVDIREVWLKEQVVAVSLNFFYLGEMHTYHAAADTRFNQFAPNTFMYFDHLRWAGSNGCHTFDFGRCKKGTGVYDFKNHWGTTVRELPYEICLIKRKSLPNFSPANPRFTKIISCWQKLPFPLVRLLSRILIPLFP